MSENIDFWHRRFEQQALWTENIRSYVFQKVNSDSNCKILEVGSGTGAVLNHIAHDLNPIKFGIDLDWKNLRYNAIKEPSLRLFHGNGMSLPVKKNVFDVCYCHYLLLWVKNPIQMLKEMKRVTKSGGWICIFAEPDYLSRIGSPKKLQIIGNIQNKSLRQQGVRLDTGRNLSNWLIKIGLSNISWGILGSHQPAQPIKDIEDIEWSTINNDLKQIIDQKEIEHIKIIYDNAFEKGSRILFVPTFYAYGQNILP
jgi:SAM-dependent methyltransferase